MPMHNCDTCRFRAYAERKPDSFIARLWRWHTKWCPGWRAYQRTLNEQQEHADKVVQDQASPKKNAGGKLLRCLFVLPLLIACGCSRDIPEVKESSAEKHLVMLPGVEGSGWQLSQMVKGLRDAGLEHEIDIIPWGRYPFGTLSNLMNIERNRERAKDIAAHITEMKKLHPEGEIILLGYSGGGGIAALTLESMPNDVKISRLILVAAALSPGYDLSKAASHTEEGVTSYYSLHDDFFLSLGTALFGTIDRVHTRSAGRDGFKDAAGRLRADEDLKQIPWRNQWFSLGHWGGHLGWLSRGWARDVLAPELMGRNAGALSSIECTAAIN